MDYKRVLRLHYVQGLSSRAISESTRDGKTTINEFLKRFRENEVLKWPHSDDVTNEMIERLLYQKPGNSANDDYYRSFNECFLQVLFGKSCREKWRKLNLHFGEICRCPGPGTPTRGLQTFIIVYGLYKTHAVNT